MHATRIASAALLGAAALGLTAPPAAAVPEVNTTPYDFKVTPSTVAAGGRVTLTAGGCPTTATAASGVFDTVTIPSGGAATAAVDRDARPGAVYSVSFACGSETASVNLTIAGARPTASSTSLAPTRGVRGGLGGSAGGVDAGEVAAGAVLVAAAATAAVYVIRRRSSDRQH
ncbi:hypothetical protein [Streptomyces sp. MUM 178J]|uniref:hypothetical protein n=1 Tax=Streptomyces sp. MUM 178J TaxID=2791991 RepID=UPI001F0345F6|nr:hypothetical protein [Streptomyces sp. MUM 178J]WRQ79905.1 hypothetical protein I3F59_011400 [Streptomyces sp. MUM 178J]